MNEFYIFPDELRDAGFGGNKSIIAGYVHSRIMNQVFYDDRVPEAFVFPRWMIKLDECSSAPRQEVR